jgi:FkbM family methyltransferase
MSLQRGLMELAWQAVPSRRRILQSLARAPPLFKGAVLLRVARVGLEVEKYRDDEEMPTNLALDGPVVWMPIRCGRVYFFGKPAKRFGEASTIRLCRSLLVDAGGFVDIGAHVGLYLWPLVTLFGPTRPAYFFEPHPELFRILQTNAGRLSPHLKGFPLAVDDHDGHTMLHIDTDDWSMSTVVKDIDTGRRYEKTQVECVRFDSFARDFRLREAVVKADIEGGETRILRGLASSGTAVRDFVCEVLQPAFQLGFVSQAAASLDADAYLIADGRLLPAAHVKCWSGTQRNWLFTRRPHSALERVLRRSGLRIANYGK